MLAEENKFGPDKNLPLQNAVSIRIPAKKKLSICFDSSSMKENVLIIYEGIRSATGSPMTYRELPIPIIKGNFPTETRRNLTNAIIPNPSQTAAMYVIFTGWHKDTAPNTSKPWKVSNVDNNHYTRTGIPTDDINAVWGRISFEDTILGDEDYNDIVAYYTHIVS